MGYNDEHNQITARMAAAFPNAAIAWPNVSFTPPDPPSNWMRLTIVDGNAFQTSIGASTNNFRNVGLLIVQVFSPENAGSSSALQAADAVADAFRNWCGSTVRCRAASVKEIGPDGKGWYQVNVTIPFQRDELH